MYLPKAEPSDYEFTLGGSKSEGWGINQKHPYKSFKFAAVDGGLWREDDTTVAAFDLIPQCLITLAKACKSHFEGRNRQLDYLNTYAKLEDILSPRAKKPQYEIERQNHELFLAEQPQDRVQLIQTINERGQHIPDHKSTEKNNFMHDALLDRAPELMLNRDFWHVLIFIHPRMLEKLPEDMRDDEAFLNRLSEGTMSSQILSIASERLRHNREFVLRHIEECRHSFFQLPLAMRCDREVARKAIEASPGNYSWAHPYEDFETTSIRKKIKSTFNGLVSGLPDLRKDLELARLALSHPQAYSYVLRNAPYSIRNNEELIDLKPVEFYENASKRIRSCKEHAERVAMHSVYGSRHFPKKLKKDKAFILELLRKGADPSILEGLGNDITTDKDFMMEAITINGRAIDYARQSRLFSVDDVFKGDEHYDAVKIAVKNYPDCVSHIPSDEMTLERLRELTNINPKAISHANFKFDDLDKDQRAEVKDIVLDAIKRDITLIEELNAINNNYYRCFLRSGGENIAKDILYDYDTVSMFLDLLLEHHSKKECRGTESLIVNFHRFMPDEFSIAPAIFARISKVVLVEQSNKSFYSNQGFYNPIPQRDREKWIYDLMAYHPKNIGRFENEAKPILSSPDLTLRLLSQYTKNGQEEAVAPYLRFMPVLQNLGFEALTNVDDAMKVLSQYAMMPPRPLKHIDLSAFPKPTARRDGIHCVI
jgi:hypothetical protein